LGKLGKQWTTQTKKIRVWKSSEKHMKKHMKNTLDTCGKTMEHPFLKNVKIGKHMGTP